MYQAVIFDLDGVITDTAAFHFEAWRKMACELGIEIDLTFNENLKGLGRMESLDAILAFAGVELSQSEKQDWAARKNAYYLELLKDLSPEDCFDGVPELLTRLREKGLKLGLASASKNVFTVVEALALTLAFDFIADANKVANSKPAPDIFLAAAEGLGLSPDVCIGVEDAKAGVEAIKLAGMFAIGVGDATELAEADIVIKDTHEFPWAIL